MLSFIIQRLLKCILVLFVIAVFNFTLIHSAPGDPATILAGQSGGGDEEYIARIRNDFGLDHPLLFQLWVYIKGLATFDLGYSHLQKMPVFDLIMAHLPATLLLTISAFILAVSVGVVLGILAAHFAQRFADTFISTVAMMAYATPIFWVGMMLVLIFSVHLDWLPQVGFETIGEQKYTGVNRLIDILGHLILPALTLGLFYMAVYTRLTRASLLEVKQMDFVKTARAKGLSEYTVMTRHVLRNALLPIITYAGIQAGSLIGGSLLVETVFGWPGIGRLAYDALIQRDYNLLLGIFYIASVTVVLINLITDLLYTVVDPRIQLQ